MELHIIERNASWRKSLPINKRKRISVPETAIDLELQLHRLLHISKLKEYIKYLLSMLCISL
jgi:hypothetical protein